MISTSRSLGLVASLSWDSNQGSSGGELYYMSVPVWSEFNQEGQKQHGLNLIIMLKRGDWISFPESFQIFSAALSHHSMSTLPTLLVVLRPKQTIVPSHSCNGGSIHPRGVMSTSVLCTPAHNLSEPTVLQLRGLCFHFDGNLIVLAGSSWVQSQRERENEKNQCVFVCMCVCVC